MAPDGFIQIKNFKMKYWIFIIFIFMSCSTDREPLPWDNPYDPSVDNSFALEGVYDTTVVIRDSVKIKGRVTTPDKVIDQYIWYTDDSSFIDTTDFPETRFSYSLDTGVIRVNLDAIDEFGIRATTLGEVEIEVIDSLVAFAGADTIVAKNSSITIFGKAASKSKNISYAWQLPGTFKFTTSTDGNLNFTSPDSIVSKRPYILKATDQLGNEDLDTVLVSFLNAEPIKTFPIDSNNNVRLDYTTFSWSPGAYNSQYRLIIAQDSALTQNRVERNITDTTYQMVLTKFASYYWTVIGIDHQGNEASEGFVSGFQTYPHSMIRIIGGTFNMGDATLLDPELNEKLKENVSVSDFWIDSTEVTIEAFMEVARNHIHINGNFDDEGCITAHCPINNVTWYEAALYANELSKLDGLDTLYSYTDIVDGILQNVQVDSLSLGYRLPTEAEWEYAARGGVSGVYPWGNDTSQIDSFAWYNLNSGEKLLPQVVAQKQPNAFGLYDMIGNVAEWTNDLYSQLYNDDFTDPFGPSIADTIGEFNFADNNVYRGCSSVDGDISCRVSNRFTDTRRQHSQKFLGFRLILQNRDEDD